MNVLELCLSDGRGGLEFYVADTVQYFADNNINCHCIVSPDTALHDLLQGKQSNVTTLRRRWRDGPLFAALKLAAYIQRHHIDLVHINWGHDLPLAVLAKRLSRRRVKLVYSRHMRWVKPKRDTYHRWLYASVDRLLTITRQLKEQAGRFLPIAPEKVEVCYLGRPPCPPFSEDRCTNVFAGLEAQFRVALIGRIEHKKGQHVLVEAIRKLKEDGLAVGAVIIGHAMDEAYLQNLKKRVNANALDKQIGFMDFVADPMTILPCFDTLVLTTYEETFGLVLVEAMHCGLAVIGTRAGGVKEIIDEGDTGLLFEPGDATELAACIKRYYENGGERQAIASRGREKARKQFSREQHYQCLMDAIRATDAEN